jgi:hypothetical protein
MSTGSSSVPAVFSWKAYWSYKERCWRHHDLLSCIAKLALLVVNIIKPFSAAPEHHQLRIIWASASAGVAFIIVAATLWLMQTRPEDYQKKYRRQLLMLHWAAVAVVIAVSFPMFMATKTTSQSIVARIILLLFKTGAAAPVLAALMNRLPWQHVLCMSSLFGALLSVTWVRQFCLHSDDLQDAELVSSIAAWLDYVCGFGNYTSSSTSRHAHIATGDVIGMTNVPNVTLTWKPTAGSIAAACATAAAAVGSNAGSTGNVSSSSSNGVVGDGALLQPPLSHAEFDQQCSQVTLGQCIAVVNVVNLWVGVLLVLFVVLLVERYSKWQYLHQHGRALQAPDAYKSKSRRTFLRTQLLQLHVLLDVPLLLLWMGFTNLHRPAGIGADLAVL